MLDWFDYRGHICIAFEMLGLSVFDFMVSLVDFKDAHWIDRLQFSGSIQSLHLHYFELICRVWCGASSGFKVADLGDKAPWSWRIFIKQIRNLNSSKNILSSFWSFSPTSGLTVILRQRWLLPSVVNSRPTAVACRSHSVSSFVHSMITTRCDTTCHVARWCQPRFVLLLHVKKRHRYYYYSHLTASFTGTGNWQVFRTY